MGDVILPYLLTAVTAVTAVTAEYYFGVARSASKIRMVDEK